MWPTNHLYCRLWRVTTHNGFVLNKALYMTVAVVAVAAAAAAISLFIFQIRSLANRSSVSDGVTQWRMSSLVCWVCDHFSCCLIATMYLSLLCLNISIFSSFFSLSLFNLVLRCAQSLKFNRHNNCYICAVVVSSLYSNQPHTWNSYFFEIWRLFCQIKPAYQFFQTSFDDKREYHP